MWSHFTIVVEDDVEYCNCWARFEASNVTMMIAKLTIFIFNDISSFLLDTRRKCGNVIEDKNLFFVIVLVTLLASNPV